MLNEKEKEIVKDSSEHDSNALKEVKDLKVMMVSLTETMNSFCDQITTRINDIETNLSKKISNIIDKKIETAVGKIERKVKKDDELANLKSEFSRTVDEFKREMNDIESCYTKLERDPADAIARDESKLRIVIRNLPENRNENIQNKVNGLLKDGLQLKDISLRSVERKKSNRENRAGIVLVCFDSFEDKRKVMETKRKLRDTRNFKDVFIEHDLPRSQRMLNANLRNIVRTIGKDKLEIKGSRVQVKSVEDSRNSEDCLNIRQTRRSDRQHSGYERRCEHNGQFENISRNHA